MKAARVVGTLDLLVYRSREDARVGTLDADDGARTSNSSRSSTGSGHGILPIRAAISARIPNLQAAPSLQRHSTVICASSSTSNSIPDPPVMSKARGSGRRRVSRAGILRIEHAPIFFGQDGAPTKAMVQLVASAEALPFLLVLGASGSGSLPGESGHRSEALRAETHAGSRSCASRVRPSDARRARIS